MLESFTSAEIDTRKVITDFVENEFGHRLENNRRSATLKLIASQLPLRSLARFTLLFSKKPRNFDADQEKVYGLIAKAYYPNRPIPNGMTAYHHCMNVLGEVRDVLLLPKDFNIDYLMLALIGRIDVIDKLDENKLSEIGKKKLAAIAASTQKKVEATGDVVRVATVLRNINFLDKLIDTNDALKGIALHAVARIGDLKMVEYLYNQYDKKISKSDKGSALNVAAEFGHLFVVQYLYEQCSAELTNEEKSRAFMWAANNGHLFVVEYLYGQYGEVVSEEDKKHALFFAANFGYLDVVKYLIERCGTAFSNDDIVKAIARAETTRVYVQELKRSGHNNPNLRIEDYSDVIEYLEKQMVAAPSDSITHGYAKHKENSNHKNNSNEDAANPQKKRKLT